MSEDKKAISQAVGSGVGNTAYGFGCISWLILILVIFQPGFGAAVVALVNHWASR